MRIASINLFLALLAAIVTVTVAYLASRSQSLAQVDAGGHLLRVLVCGSGGPTVVFENGLGRPLETWHEIQTKQSDQLTTVAYDRAGTGRSEEGPFPRDARQISLELRTILQNVNAPPPYILVGHSFGGLYIRTFASMYPDDVAAMILVDPTRDDAIDQENFDGAEYAELDAGLATSSQAREAVIPEHIPVYLIVAMGVPNSETPYDEPISDKSKRLRNEALSGHTRWLQGIFDGQLIVTHNSGHGVPYEEPELITKTIGLAIAKSNQ